MDRILRYWWSGEMSENRRKCYESIHRNSNISQIECINPGNYKNYEVIDHPIHEGFKYLSAVHQSDYMRAYVTYHHGGAWTDVKYCDFDWNLYFDILECNPDKFGIGSREMTITPDGRYCNHPDNYVHSFCIGMQEFIFNSKTPVFKTYIENIDKKLDLVLDDLKKYPGHVHPMVCLDNHLHYTPFPDHLRNYKYPLTWLGISGYFFNAQLPYLHKIILGMPPPHLFLTGHPHR